MVRVLVKPVCQSEGRDHGLDHGRDQQVAVGNDEWPKAGDEKVDLETQVATYYRKLEATAPKSSALDDEVAELHAHLGSLSAQLKTGTMRADELKIFSTTVETPVAVH